MSECKCKGGSPTKNIELRVRDLELQVSRLRLILSETIGFLSAHKHPVGNTEPYFPELSSGYVEGLQRRLADELKD